MIVIQGSPSKTFPNDIFWLDSHNKPVLRYNDHDNSFMVDYYRVWRSLQNFKYNTTAKDITSIFKVIIKEHLFHEFNELKVFDTLDRFDKYFDVQSDPLNENDSVEFDIEKDDKGERAINVKVSG